MSDCIFCKIINNEIPSTKVFENEHVLAFNDINPEAPVHILVIPKAHYKSILEIEDMDIISEMHKAIKIIVKEKNIDQSGFRLVNNCGQDANQLVDHIHYHILGGKKL